MINTRLYKLLTWIMLVILVLPASTMVQADSPQQDNLDCPPYREELAKDASFWSQLPPECKKIFRHDILSGRQSDPGMALLSTGGPDEFGYTFDDTVSESWIPGTINTGLVGDDEASSLNIGFDFPFYGLTYSQLYFNTNGLVTFGEDYFWYGGDPIPLIVPPNNFIAPFWEDLLVGDGYNNGGIYYGQGGSAPNRYLVLEWRNVETYSGSSLFSFEVILYENGDIVFQHQSLPTEYSSTVGIENSLGDDGLEYQSGDEGLSAPKKIRFYFPTEPAARLLLSPKDAGEFSVPGAVTEFTVPIVNTGNVDIDTYDLTVTADWSYGLYAQDGITPLTDTDTDGVVDTGPLDMGASTSIVARFTAPADGIEGATNAATLTVTSSLDDSVTKTANLSTTIPANFANVFMHSDDGEMSFMTASSDGTNIYKATNDSRFGYDLAVERLTTGNYFYAWADSYFNGRTQVREIQYAILDRNGNIVLPARKLTNNAAATLYIGDENPSIAIAPNGTIGVIWSHYTYDYSQRKSNSNVFMATLTPTGTLIKRVNLTNKTLWDNGNTLNIPYFFDVTIASTDDNRFVIGWREERQITVSNWTENIWYTVRDTAGASVFPAKALTSDGESIEPVLNSLADGKTILTWSSFGDGGPFYAVIDSAGALVKNTTSLGDGIYDWSADAVQLANGKVAIAWGGYDIVQFGILNSSYDLESGPATGFNPSHMRGDYISVTTDESNHVIMTWANDYNLFYALGDDTGAFVTNPMLYERTVLFFNTSTNGQGNAPFKMPSTTPPQVLSSLRVEPDYTKLTTVNFKVTFSEPVTGVDKGDFALVTTGVMGASISKVTGFGDTHTVTVNTGTGNGTIHLDVVDNDTIDDEFGNRLGGDGLDNGSFTSGETFTVVKGAPGVPALLSPANAAIVTELQPVMDWKDSAPVAHHYQIQIATNSNFSSLVADETDLLTSTYPLSSDLIPGKLYYWRVRAYNVVGGVSAWSAVRTFKTALAQVTLVSPADLEPLLTDRPTFEWNPVDGATQYNLQVSASANFGTLLVNATATGPEYMATKDLPQNKTLYWRVRAKTPVVVGPWSAKWSFKTGNPPTVPGLTAPPNGALVKDYTPPFNWNNSTLPAGTTFKHYEIQWDDNKEFSSPEISTTTPGDINDSDFTPLADLAPNSTFYWRVQAVNTVGVLDHTSGWSAVWSLRTVILPPAGLTATPSVLKPTFEWDDATGPGVIKSYTIQVSTSASFSTLLLNTTTPYSYYAMTKNLPAGKLLYWRVRVNGANGPSGWTTVQYTTPAP